MICAVVDEQRVGRAQAEAVEREIIDRGIGLQQLDLARDDDVAEAGEEGALLRVEGRPEIGREIGDREQRHAARVELLDDLVDARHRTGDRLAEALAPGRDQRGIFGEFLAELGRGLGIGPAAVQRLVPAIEVDILDEAQARLIVGDLPDEEGVGIPAVKDVADVEDDGASSAGHARERQPWRALKRRLVLLMT